ncbi:hypothetical protein TUM17382_15010 [Shewanella algae]|nr:hypothetical protein TUM17382_15010 [Shewanella algae]
MWLIKSILGICSAQTSDSLFIVKSIYYCEETVKKGDFFIAVNSTFFYIFILNVQM